jgi:hypothetical protein
VAERHILNLFHRKDHGGYTGDTLYQREGTTKWRPLRAFAHFEFGDPDRLATMQKAGIKHVQWLTAHHDNECEACKALEGKLFPIKEPPTMPPLDCRCELWCRCILVAAKAS